MNSLAAPTRLPAPCSERPPIAVLERHLPSPLKNHPLSMMLELSVWTPDTEDSSICIAGVDLWIADFRMYLVDSYSYTLRPREFCSHDDLVALIRRWTTTHGRLLHSLAFARSCDVWTCISAINAAEFEMMGIAAKQRALDAAEREARAERDAERGGQCA